MERLRVIREPLGRRTESLRVFPDRVGRTARFTPIGLESGVRDAIHQFLGGHLRAALIEKSGTGLSKAVGDIKFLMTRVFSGEAIETTKRLKASLGVREGVAVFAMAEGPKDLSPLEKTESELASLKEHRRVVEESLNGIIEEFEAIKKQNGFTTDEQLEELAKTNSEINEGLEMAEKLAKELNNIDLETEKLTAQRDALFQESLKEDPETDGALPEGIQPGGDSIILDSPEEAPTAEEVKATEAPAAAPEAPVSREEELNARLRELQELEIQRRVDLGLAEVNRQLAASQATINDLTGKLNKATADAVGLLAELKRVEGLFEAEQGTSRDLRNANEKLQGEKAEAARELADAESRAQELANQVKDQGEIIAGYARTRAGDALAEVKRLRAEVLALKAEDDTLGPLLEELKLVRDDANQILAALAAQKFSELDPSVVRSPLGRNLLDVLGPILADIESLKTLRDSVFADAIKHAEAMAESGAALKGTIEFMKMSLAEQAKQIELIRKEKDAAISAVIAVKEEEIGQLRFTLGKLEYMLSLVDSYAAYVHRTTAANEELDFDEGKTPLPILAFAAWLERREKTGEEFSSGETVIPGVTDRRPKVEPVVKTDETETGKKQG